MSQLHKRFNNNQVKELLKRYLNKEIERKYIQEILGIKKARFFELINKYRENPDEFSIQYSRNSKTRSVSKKIVFHRKMLGISQKELAQRLGVDPTTLGRWKKDKRRPEKECLEKINYYLPDLVNYIF